MTPELARPPATADPTTELIYEYYDMDPIGAGNDTLNKKRRDMRKRGRDDDMLPYFISSPLLIYPI